MDADGVELMQMIENGCRWHSTELGSADGSETGSADGCELGFADENGRRLSRMDADGLEWMQMI